MNPVYAQIGEQCTAEAIRNLLRDIQDRSNMAKSEIHVSGNKDELVRNLCRAVEFNFATIDEVYGLLWDSEEVGKQHILLLTPAPDELGSRSASMDGESVSGSLFDDMPIGDQFPRYEYPTSGYDWTDFRLQGNGGWLGKAYGREVWRQSRGIVKTEEVGEGIVREIREYSWKEVKTVLVANWRPSRQILELRIDISNLQNEKATEERRMALWTLLQPAIEKTDLIGLNIDQLLERIIFERHQPQNQERYAISRVELTDPRSGQVRVIPRSSDSLDDEPGRRASLEAMRRNSFLPSLVRIEWKTGLDGCPKCMTEPISVVLEKTSNGPELRILKQITNATYEYIFNQLRSRL